MIYALLGSLTFWCISLQSFSRHICTYHRLNVSPCQINMLKLIPTLMVIRSWAFGKWLDPESGPLANGIGVPIKEAPACSLALYMIWKARRLENMKWTLSDAKSARALSWTSQCPVLWEIIFCYLNHPVYGIFVITAPKTKISDMTRLKTVGMGKLQAGEGEIAILLWLVRGTYLAFSH